VSEETACSSASASAIDVARAPSRDASRDALLEGDRLQHEGGGLDVRREELGVLASRARRQPEIAPPLEAPLADDRRGCRGGDRQLGVHHHGVVLELPDPVQQRARVSASREREVLLDENLGNQLEIARGRRMLDRVDRQAARPKPVAGPAMDHGRGGRLAGAQVENGELGEERVDPIPAGPFDTSHEQVRSFELRKVRGRVRTVEHGVAHVGREPAEHRGLEHERTGFLRQPRQDLLAQVVGDEAVVRAEALDGGLDVAGATEPERCKRDGGGPSFGALEEQPDPAPVQLDARALDDERAHFGFCERQVVRAKLVELAPGAEVGQTEVGVDPGDRDETDAGRHVGDGVVERGQRVVPRDGLEVVQHDHDPVAVRGERVQHVVDRELDRRADRQEMPQRALSETAPHTVEGGRDVPPQLHRVVVALVERDPGDRGVMGRGPGPDGCALAVAGGRGDQGERARALLEDLRQSRPFEEPPALPRRGELGLYEHQRPVRSRARVRAWVSAHFRRRTLLAGSRRSARARRRCDPNSPGARRLGRACFSRSHR
jgi:hypothetical protein